MSLEDVDEEQSQLVNELKDKRQCKALAEKKSFLNNEGLFSSVREKIINNSKSLIVCFFVLFFFLLSGSSFTDTGN